MENLYVAEMSIFKNKNVCLKTFLVGIFKDNWSSFPNIKDSDKYWLLPDKGLLPDVSIHSLFRLYFNHTGIGIDFFHFPIFYLWRTQCDFFLKFISHMP